MKHVLSRFSRETLERAGKTLIQAYAAAVAAGVPWKQAVTIAIAGTGLSMLTSAMSAGVGPAGTPSLVGGRGDRP